MTVHETGRIPIPDLVSPSMRPLTASTFKLTSNLRAIVAAVISVPKAYDEYMEEVPTGAVRTASHTPANAMSLPGQKNVTPVEMVEVLSEVLDKPVTYVNPPIEEWRAVLVEKVGFPETLVVHLAAVAQDYQDGVFTGVTDVV